MSEVREGGGGFARLFAKYVDALPGVAASLTTALALFLFSLLFAPVRGLLFGTGAPDYPIFCTADPVQGPGDTRIVEFYVVNRSRHGFTAPELQRTLDEALAGSGTAGAAAIRLPFKKIEGRVAKAAPDAEFNDGKGVLGVVHDADGVRIVIQQIHGASILRARIEVAGMEPNSAMTRDTKLAVPFDFEDLQESCYTRT